MLDEYAIHSVAMVINHGRRNGIGIPAQLPHEQMDLTFESDDEKGYWNQWESKFNIHRHRKKTSSLLYHKARISNQANYVVDIWSNNGLGT